MHVPVNLPGFEGRAIVVETAGMVRGGRVLIDGAPAPPGPKRGQYELRRNDGTVVIVSLRGRFPDPVPNLLVDGQTVEIAPGLRWYEWIAVGLPLLLVPLGGALGGALGAACCVGNAAVIRCSLPAPLRVLACVATTFVTGVIYVSIAMTLGAIAHGRLGVPHGR